MLSRHLPNPTVAAEPSPPVDVEIAEVRQIHLTVPRNFASLAYKPREPLLSSQARNKRYFDVRLRQFMAQNTVQAKTSLSIVCRTRRISQLDETKLPPHTRHRQSFSRNYDRNAWSVLFRVVSATPFIVTIDIDSVHETVSIDRVAIDPRGRARAAYIRLRLLQHLSKIDRHWRSKGTKLGQNFGIPSLHFDYHDTHDTLTSVGAKKTRLSRKPFGIASLDVN